MGGIDRQNSIRRYRVLGVGDAAEVVVLVLHCLLGHCFSLHLSSSVYSVYYLLFVIFFFYYACTTNKI